MVGRWFRTAARAAALALFVCAAPGAVFAQSPFGSIRGTVYDKDFSVPLPRARVSIVETFQTVYTNEKGQFVFERVPPGTYTLSVAKDGYERQVLPSIAVAPGQVAEVRADLPSEAVEMEELIVTGADLLASSEFGLLEIRAAAITVQDAVSAEVIRKAGATDAADALKLVVGASVNEGKYATVRGLSDRYTGTTLNGVRVPSADPRRRAVQVDLFPTGTIDSVTVTKTFTPDLQGDFTGGGVDLKTKAIPEGPVYGFGAAIEYNPETSGNGDFVSYENGGIDWRGYDGGRRNMPEIASGLFPQYPQFSDNPSPADVESAKFYDKAVHSFAPSMGVSTETHGANYSFSWIGGNRIVVAGDDHLGFMTGLTYQRKYDFYDEGINNQGGVTSPGDPIALTSQRDDTRGVDELLIGLLASMRWEPNAKHDLTLSIIGNQNEEDEARIQVDDAAGTIEEQNQSLRFAERTVFSAQLHGSHRPRNPFDHTPEQTLPIVVDWTVAANYARQDEPDVRFFRNVFDITTLSGEFPANTTDASRTRRIWRYIQEHNQQVQASATLPFLQGSGTEGNVRAGIFGDWTGRDYTQDSFTYRFATQFGSIFDPTVSQNRSVARFRTTDPDQLWTDVFNEPDRLGYATNNPPATNQLLWTIIPVGNDVDYTGDQDMTGAYLMADLPLHPKLHFIGGARFEKTKIGIIPVNALFGTVEIIEVLPSGDRGVVRVPQEEGIADINESDVLPSASVIWELRPGMKLRGTWSRTIARPTFRELAPVATEEFIFGDEFLGNPDIVLSSIENWDLRWEWFPRAGDVLTFSLFKKNLTDPIELISFGVSNRVFVQPINYEAGRVDGAEVEVRLGLDRWAKSLSGLAVGASYTLIDSEVDVPEEEQKSLADYGLDQAVRRLQGQPEFLATANVTWDIARTKTGLGLFYNRVGDTLLTGAARNLNDGTPNVFLIEYDTLDFTASQPLGRVLTLGFKTKNLTARDRETVYRTPDGQEAIKSLRTTSRLFTLGLAWKW